MIKKIRALDNVHCDIYIGWEDSQVKRCYVVPRVQSFVIRNRESKKQQGGRVAVENSILVNSEVCNIHI